MSKYDEVYFVGDNQVINRVRVDSSKTRNRGAFSDSLAALKNTHIYFKSCGVKNWTQNDDTFPIKYTQFKQLFSSNTQKYGKMGLWCKSYKKAPN